MPIIDNEFMTTTTIIKKLPGKTQKICLALSIAIGSLVISSELFCRYILGLGNPALLITDSTIEYLFKPNQDVRRFGNRISINQYGMRSEPISLRKTSSEEKRILVFGDSVINGGNLTDRDNLATTIVQNQLAKTQSNSVFVGNVSAGSWGPGNWLAYAKKFGFFDADTIVLVISSHDYADNPSFQPLNPQTHPQQKPLSATVELLTRYLPRYLPKLRDRKSDNRTKYTASDSNSKLSHQQSIQQGLEDLRAFLLLAQKANADVRVVQYWDRHEVETGKLQEGNQKINQLVRQLDIPVTQTGYLFQTAAKTGETAFRDVIHPSDRGQELLSKIILEALKPQEISK